MDASGTPPLCPTSHRLQEKTSSPGACKDDTYRTGDQKEYDTYGWWVGDGAMPGGLSRSKAKKQFALALQHVNKQYNSCDMTQSHAWGGTSRFDGFTTYEADTTADGHCTARDHKSTWDAGDLPSNTIAMTCSFTDSNPGVKNDLTEADVRFNVHDYKFTASGGAARCSGRFDIQGIGTHEAGHVFGLGDLGSGHANLTMSGVQTPCTTRSRSLGLGDVHGLWSIYS